MLVFVIPQRNREIAHDWDHVNRLCQQTVRSALAQTDRDVRVIVVCKDFVPGLEDDRLTILRTPFPTPADNWNDRIQDKYNKIAHGLIEARKYAPCYVMKLDADDLLDRHLAAEVHKTNHKPGYYIRHGYRWREGSLLVRPVDNFHLGCGSSNIIWCEKDDLPSSPDDDMSAFKIMRFGHNITVSEYEKLHTPLMPIPSRAAIYRIGHGENFTANLVQAGVKHTKPNWKFWVGAALRLSELRPFTSSMRRDFFGA